MGLKRQNSLHSSMGVFPDSSVGKESICNTGDPGSIPGSGRSPGEEIGYALQYSWASLVAQLVKNNMKRVASPGSMHDTGCLGLVQWDDPEGWYGEGGGRRVQDGEHVYTCGGFNIWQNQYNIVKLKKKKKNLPLMRETWVQSLGWEDHLEKAKATHSSIMAWRIPWTI